MTQFLADSELHNSNRWLHTKVLFKPTTDGTPAFATVSGDKAIPFPWPFDLTSGPDGTGDWTVSTKIENYDTESQEILVVSKRTSTLSYTCTLVSQSAACSM